MNAVALPDEVGVTLVQVVRSDEVHLELEPKQEFFFAGQNLFLSEGSVRDLFRNHFRVQGVNVLVLRREVHAADARLVDVGVLKHCVALLSSQVAVEDRHGQEVSSSCALERGGNFYHPVNHLRSVFFTNVVFIKRRLGRVLVQGHEVLMDLLV